MADDFLTLLSERVLVCDGAMGTMLYAAGVPLDRPLPALNLSRPELVRAIHGAYVSAGADVIQTNTFGANRYTLARHGLEAQVGEINRAGPRIAREARAAAPGPVLVAGAVSPVAGAGSRTRLSTEQVRAAFREQIEALVEGGVDLLLFETFGDLAELRAALDAAREVARLPVIAQMTFVDDGQTLAGDRPAEVATTLEEAGADVIGVNCTLGPHGVLQVVRQLALHTTLPLSAQPNAGQPILIDGQFQFAANPDYVASYARRLVELGVAVIGGCCGTTPHHIEAVAREARGLHPRVRPARTTVSPTSAPPPDTSDDENRNGFAAKLAGGRFVIACEMRPPAGGDAERALHDARLLKEAGADVIVVAASTSPRAQISPVTLAMLVQQRVQIDTVLTVTTWDKSLASLQADLLGAYAFGIRNVICRTGSPPSHGSYVSPGGIWDVDSLGLIEVLQALNGGRDCNGVPLGKPTSFFIGTRVNSVGTEDDGEYAYARRKVAAGIHFLATPPVFDPAALQARRAMIGAASTPMLMGVLPVRDVSHAEYLRHEVPEIYMPDDVLERMRVRAPDIPEVGLELARELVLAAQPQHNGILLSADASVEQMVALLRSLPV